MTGRTALPRVTSRCEAADVAFWLAIKTRVGLEAEFVNGEAHWMTGDRQLTHHVLAFVPMVLTP